jgi:hypothetical protein
MGVEILDPETLVFGDPEIVAGDASYETLALAVDVDGRSLLTTVTTETLAARSEIRIDLGWGRHVIEAISSQR